MPPALIAKHCNELLAELERVTSGRSPFERSWARAHSLESAPSRDDARAVQLAQLFTAIEGAHLGSATDGADDRASTGARSVA